MAESTIRSGRKHGYTVIQNPILGNTEISLRTKGLYVSMVSLPDDWSYSISGLAVKFGAGKDTIRSGLKELEEHGYLVREKQCREGGKFSGGVTFILYDEPNISPSSGFPTTGEPSTDKPSSGNPTQQSKDLQSKDNKPPISPRDKLGLSPTARVIIGGYCPESPEITKALHDFMEVRVKRKAVNSDAAIERLLVKLDKLSGFKDETRLRLLETAIENGWKSVYPLKDAGGAKADEEGEWV